MKTLGLALGLTMLAIAAMQDKGMYASVHNKTRFFCIVSPLRLHQRINKAGSGDTEKRREREREREREPGIVPMSKEKKKSRIVGKRDIDWDYKEGCGNGCV